MVANRNGPSKGHVIHITVDQTIGQSYVGSASELRLHMLQMFRPYEDEIQFGRVSVVNSCATRFKARYEMKRCAVGADTLIQLLRVRRRQGEHKTRSGCLPSRMN